jgi:hypothetical protein
MFEFHSLHFLIVPYFIAIFVSLLIFEDRKMVQVNLIGNQAERQIKGRNLPDGKAAKLFYMWYDFSRRR